MHEYCYLNFIYPITQVVDLGCSECGIVRFYREVPSIQKIQLIDIDRSTLEAHKNYIKPRPCDYIFKRDNPLSIEIFEGSATDVDQRIMGCDAISMVEFIEHLYPDTLRRVEETVFSRLYPSIVVVTTPNYEFNSLFPGPIRFRHYDHKFEWTRGEFQKWGQDVCDKYGYTVCFDGIGNPPPECQHVGFCSQAAIFCSSSPHRLKEESEGNVYSLVAESVFPHKDKETLSSDEILKLEVSYVINLLKRAQPSPREQDDIEDVDQIHIPISRLMNFTRISKLVNIESLRMFLVDNGYQLTEDQSNLITPMDDECEDHDGWHSDEGTEKLPSDTETEVGGDQTLCTAPAIDSDNSAELWE
uniref:Small RNA 2'-O-methyltransferase n=2 Tax=Crassostrea virginica TaxID=6565 RepID=A0A8B8DAS6_CRAVI|nr:small RNA 2'-O-methyltransferase-like isoform X1 [Crassostrea virginica]